MPDHDSERTPFQNRASIEVLAPSALSLADYFRLASFGARLSPRAAAQFEARPAWASPV